MMRRLRFHYLLAACLIGLLWGAILPVRAAGLDYQTKVLPNGIKLVYKNLPNAKTITTRIMVPTGFLNEPQGLHQISHLLEHLVYRGGGRFTAADFQSQVKDKALEYNGFTSLDNTEYYLEVLPENLLNCLDIYLDLILHTNLAEGDIALEKKVVTVEKAMRTFPGNTYFLYINSLTQEQLSENIQAITRADLEHYHDQYYRTDNLTVIITGPFDLKKVQDLLASQKSGNTSTPGEPVVWNFKESKDELVLDDYLLGEEYRLLLGFNLPKPTPKDLLVAKVLPFILKYESPQYDYMSDRPLDYEIFLTSMAGQYFLILSYRDCNQKYTEEMNSWHQKNFIRYCKYLKAKKFNKFLEALTKAMDKDIKSIETESTSYNEFIVGKLFMPEAIHDNDLEGIRKLSSDDFKNFVQKYLEVNSYSKIVIKAL
jgi:predicted Zn-dependent peptidase